MAEEIQEEGNISQKINTLEKETLEPGFLGLPHAQDVLRELRELKKRKEEEGRQSEPAPKKDVFLIITRDTSIFDANSPSGKLVADISSLVTELHIIYLGRKKQLSNKLTENTYIYVAPYIPFFSFLTVYQVILSEVVWKKRFLPTVVLSIGDEVVMSKIFAKKYGRPFYVFYSYMKTLGRSNISMSALVRLYPQQIIVPNEYIAQAIRGHFGYKSSNTEIRILNEYTDETDLDETFNEKIVEEEVNSRNNSFNMITFPRQANFVFFLKLKNIGAGIKYSIRKFQFIIVAKRGQYLYAKLLRFLFALPAVVVKENKESINLFHTARFMLYFENSRAPYDPIFYSLFSGCPVLSSGDEYTKIILFNSGFEEFNKIGRSSSAFAVKIIKLINDQYLYQKYKMNCVGFAKSAFTHDHDKFIKELAESLKVGA